jgi:hypothetical protein
MAVNFIFCAALLMAASAFSDDPECYVCRGEYGMDGSHSAACTAPDDGNWGSSSCTIRTIADREVCTSFGSGCYYIVVTP